MPIAAKPNETTIADAYMLRFESFYNLVQIAEATGYSNPMAALRATGKKVMLEKDANGNVVKCWLLDADLDEYPGEGNEIHAHRDHGFFHVGENEFTPGFWDG